MSENSFFERRKQLKEEIEKLTKECKDLEDTYKRVSIQSRQHKIGTKVQVVIQSPYPVYHPLYKVQELLTEAVIVDVHINPDTFKIKYEVVVINSNFSANAYVKEEGKYIREVFMVEEDKCKDVIITMGVCTYG